MDVFSIRLGWRDLRLVDPLLMLKKLYGKFIESGHIYFAVNLAAKPAKVADVDAIPTRREKK